MSPGDLERLEAQLLLIRQMVADLGGRHIQPAALSLKEAAEMLSCSPDHIAKMVKNGTLRPRDLDGVRRIPVTQIHSLLEDPKEPERPTVTRRPRFNPNEFSAKLRRLRKP